MHSMKSSGSGGMAEFKDLLATLSDPKKFQSKIDDLENKLRDAAEASRVANEKIILAKELEASLKMKQEDLETLSLSLESKKQSLDEIERSFSNREVKVNLMEKDVSAKKITFEAYKNSASDDLVKQQTIASKQMIEAQAMLDEAKSIQKEVEHRMARMKAALS